MTKQDLTEQLASYESVVEKWQKGYFELTKEQGLLVQNKLKELKAALDKKNLE